MPAPGVYVWEVPGKPISIHLNLDVVDRLQQDVIRGFGLVPRRGAEVGGILLGAAEAGPVVHVEDYELIPIEYKRGPSYLLSDEDVQAFEETLDKLRNSIERGAHPIGYFRSHTRDGVGLGDEDLEMVSRYLPEPDTVVLLIRPFGTRPSMAGFYFREGGEFQSGPPLLEFPFRRKDLAPDEPAVPSPGRAASRTLTITRRGIPNTEIERTPARHAEEPYVQSGGRAEEELYEPAAPFEVATDLETPKPRRWIWWPVSFLFLLLGVLLGFQTALSLRPSPGGGSDPFNLSLSVTKSGSDLQVKWDRRALAIRTAQKGVLVIDDGTFNKTLDLDPNQLQNGSVVYRHYSNDVRFRLEVFPKARDSLTETVEWKP